MFYSSYDLREIAKAMVNYDIQLVPGMEKNCVRDFLTYNTDLACVKGPMNDSEIELLITYYQEELNAPHNNSNLSFTSTDEEGSLVEKAIAASILAAILAVVGAIWGFFKYESRKYILPVALIFFTIASSISSFYEKFSDSGLLLTAVIIVCLGLGVAFSFVFKRVDSKFLSKINGNEDKYITYAMAPIFVFQVIMCIINDSFTLSNAITLLLTGGFTALMYFKKEKLAALVTCVYYVPCIIMFGFETDIWLFISYLAPTLLFVFVGLYQAGIIKKDSKADKKITIAVDLAAAYNIIVIARMVFLLCDGWLPVRIPVLNAIFCFVETFAAYSIIAISKQKKVN